MKKTYSGLNGSGGFVLIDVGGGRGMANCPRGVARVPRFTGAPQKNESPSDPDAEGTAVDAVAALRASSMSIKPK